MGGGKIPYLGYTELELQIPEIKAFREDALFLIIADSPYEDWVLIQLGTIQIDRALELVTEEEINHLPTPWQRGHMGTVLGSGAACTKMNPKGFSLNKVEGDVKIMRNVTLRPFETCHVHAITKAGGHEQRVHMAIDPPSEPYSEAVITIPSYTHLKPGSSQTEVCLHNFSGKTVTLKAKSNHYSVDTHKCSACNVGSKMGVCC